MTKLKRLVLLAAGILVVAIVLLIFVFRDDAEAPEEGMVPNAAAHALFRSYQLQP